MSLINDIAWIVVMLAVAFIIFLVDHYARKRKLQRDERQARENAKALNMAVDMRPRRRIKGHAVTRSGAIVYCDTDLSR